MKENETDSTLGIDYLVKMFFIILVVFSISVATCLWAMASRGYDLTCAVEGSTEAVFTLPPPVPNDITLHIPCK